MVENREVEHVRGKIRLTGAGLLELKSRLGLSFAESQCGAAPDARSATRVAGSNRVVRNRNESPLTRLYNRKLPTGKSYISDAQLQAGEKLRMDFERGQLQPRITANYESVSGSSGNRNSDASGCDISDFAVDCRQRVNEAVELLGPELAGVALDICCFLKGLELVERERQWPPRSAKLMLRTALEMLARYYGFDRQSPSGPQKVRFWGSEDYRPSIG